MKITLRILALMMFAGCAQFSAGQTTTRSASQVGILGYLDRATGAIRVPRQPQAEIAEAAVVPTTGKLVLNFSIAIQSTVAAGSSIVCNGEASGGDPGLTYSESAFVAAVRGGATATCSVVIPYSWTLSAPASDLLEISYTIQVFGTTTGVTRTSAHVYGAIKMPATGATTTEAIAVVI